MIQKLCYQENENVFAYQISGDAIRCYDCNSNTDPRCADPFDNSTLHMKNCAYEPALSHYPNVKSTMCRKIRQKGIHELTFDWIIHYLSMELFGLLLFGVRAEKYLHVKVN